MFVFVQVHRSIIDHSLTSGHDDARDAVLACAAHDEVEVGLTSSTDEHCAMTHRERERQEGHDNMRMLLSSVLCVRTFGAVEYVLLVSLAVSVQDGSGLQ
jgi:hypothetical protein